jgi:glycosyltransferase involved in cell wall biosynthesis
VKVLIVNNMAPFIWGGAEELANHLQRNLIVAGHEAEVLRIPFQWEPAERIPSQILMVRAFELWNVDRVIALKFPAYLIRHPHKTLWLLHQYRQAYDLFEAGQTNLPPNGNGEAIKKMIIGADNACFNESKRIYTNSSVTQDRLKKYNGFNSEVLLPPVNDPELFLGGDSLGYIFAGGRVNSMKRQHLLLNAMVYTHTSVKLIIAGPPDSVSDATLLYDLVKKLGLTERVKLDLRFLARQDYADYINHAAAVAYLPFDEDSLGYVAMEAATAGKALITTLDSGGILGLVEHGITGWACSPDPKALAAAMDEASADAQRITKYGLAARDLWQSMGINWPQTVEKLLQ